MKQVNFFLLLFATSLPYFYAAKIRHPQIGVKNNEKKREPSGEPAAHKALGMRRKKIARVFFPASAPRLCRTCPRAMERLPQDGAATRAQVGVLSLQSSVFFSCVLPVRIFYRGGLI